VGRYTFHGLDAPKGWGVYVYTCVLSSGDYISTIVLGFHLSYLLFLFSSTFFFHSFFGGQNMRVIIVVLMFFCVLSLSFSGCSPLRYSCGLAIEVGSMVRKLWLKIMVLCSRYTNIVMLVRSCTVGSGNKNGRKKFG